MTEPTNDGAIAGGRDGALRPTLLDVYRQLHALGPQYRHDGLERILRVAAAIARTGRQATGGRGDRSR